LVQPGAEEKAIHTAKKPAKTKTAATLFLDQHADSCVLWKGSIPVSENFNGGRKVVNINYIVEKNN
jgi:hypothetical protein